MRATKEMFLSVAKEISNLLGEQLYLVSVSDVLYITPVNNRVSCQSNYYFCFSNTLSKANYDRLIAFKMGLEFALRRMQGN